MGKSVPEFWILLELRMMEVALTTGIIRCSKLQSNRHHQQTNIQLLKGWMPWYQYLAVHPKLPRWIQFSPSPAKMRRVVTKYAMRSMTV